MPSLTDLLGNPLTEVVKGANALIGRFVADPQAKIEAQTELAKLEADYQAKLIAADVEWAKAQADVVTTEAKSESWLARNWRPITMLTFVYIIAHNFIIAQLFSLRMLPIPDHMWELLKLGLGGYIIGRSAEKIVPGIAAALKK